MFLFRMMVCNCDRAVSSFNRASIFYTSHRCLTFFATLVGASIWGGTLLDRCWKNLIAELAIACIILAIRIGATALISDLSIHMSPLFCATRHKLLVNIVLAMLVLLMLLLLWLHVLLLVNILLSLLLRIVCLLWLAWLLHRFFGFLIVKLEHFFVFRSLQLGIIVEIIGALILT